MKNQQNSRRNRVRAAVPQTEGLETRALLTAGAGNNFAILQAKVDAANAPTTIPFTVTPALFTRPNGRITIGIDVAQKGGSTVKPLIYKITDADGKALPFSRGVYHPNVQRTPIINGNITTSVLVNLKAPRNALSQSHSYNVSIQGQDGTTGQFLVGFYLPGDSKGVGVVDKASIKAVRAAMGTMAGDEKYDFSADMNRDGVVNIADLRATQRNLGAKTTVTPVVSANLDAASDTGLQDRITTATNIKFTGTATPGSTVTYADPTKRVPTAVTKADATGNYSLNVQLASGSNTFSVTTLDEFGQTISGEIAPVTLNPNAPPAV